MQFLPTPVWVVVFGQISWLSSHGAAGISYTLFNVTMKKEVLKIFCSSIHTSSISTATPNTVNIRTGGSVNDIGLQLNF